MKIIWHTFRLLRNKKQNRKKISHTIMAANAIKILKELHDYTQLWIQWNFCITNYSKEAMSLHMILILKSFNLWCKALFLWKINADSIPINKILFINYNTILNYILIIYKLSNFDHVLRVVSQTRVYGGNRSYDSHSNSFGHCPLEYSNK